MIDFDVQEDSSKRTSRERTPYVYIYILCHRVIGSIEENDLLFSSRFVTIGVVIHAYASVHLCKLIIDLRDNECYAGVTENFITSCYTPPISSQEHVSS